MQVVRGGGSRGETGNLWPLVESLWVGLGGQSAGIGAACTVGADVALGLRRPEAGTRPRPSAEHGEAMVGPDGLE